MCYMKPVVRALNQAISARIPSPRESEIETFVMQEPITSPAFVEEDLCHDSFKIEEIKHS